MTSPHEDPPDRRWGVAFLCLGLMSFLAVQPLLMTRDPYRQTAFTWEMYAKSAPVEEFGVVTSEGERVMTVPTIQDRAHANLDYTTVLPSFICESNPAVMEVKVYVGGELSRSHLCR